MILEGDCVEKMREMDECSVDAIVTDPPYNLGFMSKPWDMQHDHEAWSREALRVLKPGGHLLAFGGTRTIHRLVCAIEDAGFEIRDMLSWNFGSGFPKSHNLAGEWEGFGTALKPAWEGITLARKPLVGTVAANVLEHGTGALNIDGTRIGSSKNVPASPSNTDSDLTYGTYGTGEGRLGTGFDADTGRWPANVALSHLPECVAVGTRKVKGAGWRDSDAPDNPSSPTGNFGAGSVTGRHYGSEETITAWECAEGCPIAMLDEQSGESTSPVGTVSGPRTHGGIKGTRLDGPLRESNSGHGDSGGASRFFYTSKASRGERNAGLDGFEASEGAAIRPKQRQCRVCGTRAMRPGPKPASEGPTCGHDDWEFVEDNATVSGEEGRSKGALRNAHPT